MYCRDPRNTLGITGRVFRGPRGALQTLDRALQRSQGHSGYPGRCVPRVGGHAEYSGSRAFGQGSSAFPDRTCVGGSPQHLARCREVARDRTRTQTHRALGRQVAEILDGADVHDVDAAVLGWERRVLLGDPHGGRALPIHGPGGLCNGEAVLAWRGRDVAAPSSLATSRALSPPGPSRGRPRAVNLAARRLRLKDISAGAVATRVRFSVKI